MKKFAAVLSFVLISVALFAQPDLRNRLTVTLNHENGQYAKGDTIKVFASTSWMNPVDLEITVIENGIRKGTTACTVYPGPRFEPRKPNVQPYTQQIFTDVRDSSVAVILEFHLAGETPATFVREIPMDMNAFKIGYVVAPEGFKTNYTKTKTVKRWWKKQIRTLRRTPMSVSLKPYPLSENDAKEFECFEFELSSIDTIPVRGYIARPKNAQAKSLPIMMLLHAAGVSGSWCTARASNAMRYAKKGAICIDFNAHGMLNEQPEAYYKDLERNRLRGYGEKPLVDRESYYFRTMILRAVRALDYVAKDPAWDGKRVILSGESQGGAQAAALAGLDGRVSDVVINVPAMIGSCSWFAGRSDSWPWVLEFSGVKTLTPISPYEGATAATAQAAIKYAPYFDGAVLLKDSKANFLVEIGLIDVTCPAANVWSGLNQVKGDVRVISSPYRKHGLWKMPAQYKPWWDENVEKVRTEYVDSLIRGN